jgi:hypothetical protein
MCMVTRATGSRASACMDRLRAALAVTARMPAR